MNICHEAVSIESVIARVNDPLRYRGNPSTPPQNSVQHLGKAIWVRQQQTAITRVHIFFNLPL